MTAQKSAVAQILIAGYNNPNEMEDDMMDETFKDHALEALEQVIDGTWRGCRRPRFNL